MSPVTVVFFLMKTGTFKIFLFLSSKKIHLCKFLALLFTSTLTEYCIDTETDNFYQSPWTCGPSQTYYKFISSKNICELVEYDDGCYKQNRFKSKQTCETYCRKNHPCVDISSGCKTPPNRTRYRYDKFLNRCIKVQDSQCYGHNRFYTKQACIDNCEA